jgi:hypothetical protein
MKSRKEKAKGGMLAISKIATKTASGVAQKAVLEYGQRKGSKIISSGVQDPNSLKDPSLYLTGKKRANLVPILNTDLIKTKNIKLDENYNPNLAENYNPNLAENYNPNLDENYNPNLDENKHNKKKKMVGGITVRKNKSRKNKSRKYYKSL